MCPEPKGAKRELLVLAMSALLLTATGAETSWAQGSGQREAREKLLKKLGLPQKATPQESPTEPDDEDAAALEAEAEEEDRDIRKLESPWPKLHPVLVTRCGPCHREKSAAGAKFLITGKSALDQRSVSTVLAGKKIEESPFFKATGGKGHMAVKEFSFNSKNGQLLARWKKEEDKSRLQDAAAQGPVEKADKERPQSAQSIPEAVDVAEAQEQNAEPVPLVKKEGGGFSQVHAFLVNRCGACHQSSESDSSYFASSDPIRHHKSLRRFVNLDAPLDSLLFKRAVGVDHGGGPIIEDTSPEAELLLRWIESGAPYEKAPSRSETPAPSLSEGMAGELPGIDAGHGPSAPPSHTHDELLASMRILLRGIRLNGNFDLSYERRGYTDNPFDEKASNVLRSYHHFIYLSRQTESDPFGLDVELTSLQFWNVSYRLPIFELPLKMEARLGKILVPFGADPIFHQAYGGLAGFDQKILPVVWATEGVSFNARAGFGPLRVKDDLFLIRGFQLSEPNAPINLQADQSNLDNIHFGLGNRSTVSVGPFSTHYSFFFNGVEKDRLLFMQALDLVLWGWRGIPVLEDFSLSAGLLRADVSGGGPGIDHYHFGSYTQLRYSPLSWLTLQYRQGLRTFENKGGLYIDDLRLGSEDASTHSLGAIFRWRGVRVGLWHFWNLEKVDEIDDDFLRVTVGYGF
jgi:hypothetical protein